MSRNQGVEKEMVILTVAPSDPTAKFLISVLMTFCSAGLEVLVPKEQMFPPEDSKIIPLN